VYLSVATKKKDIEAKRYPQTRMTFTHLLMVPDDVSKFHYIDLILLDPGAKINEVCYCTLLHNNCCLSYVRTLASS